MIIRKSTVVSENDERYSKKFVSPVIPNGYRHIAGTNWKTGFQIERIKDGSLFQFVPVGCLKSNGTLDGINFTEKFGRRKFYPDNSDELGEEPIHGTMNLLWNQFQSVREYGGFYVSCVISRSKDLKPISVPGRQPWTMVDFDHAMYLAKSFEVSRTSSSHLLFGAEYDSLLEWFIESNKMEVQEVTGQWDSVGYGNIYQGNILGFGTVAEWTQEKTIVGTSSKPAVRGTTLTKEGARNPLAWRQGTQKYIKRPYIGFRIALLIL